MGVTKIFKNMTPEQRSKWANLQLIQAERKASQWRKITRKLAEDKKFTPMEEDLIDTVLEKDGNK